MRWFGRNWDAPVNQKCEEDHTPTKLSCEHCGQAFVEGDRGIVVDVPLGDVTWGDKAWHLRCLLSYCFGVEEHLDRLEESLLKTLTLARRAGFKPPKDPIR